MYKRKFRVWDKKLGKIRFDLEAPSTYTHSAENLDLLNMFELLNEQYDFMQFIGKKDLHQNDIYEKDIVKTSKGNCVICFDCHQCKYKAVPISLYLENAGRGGWSGFSMNVVEEVIGDIYQNGELLVLD